MHTISRHPVSLWTTALACLFLTSSCSSEPSREQPDTKSHSGQEKVAATSLFNGRDLEGWHTNSEEIGHGTGGRWTVEEGAIVGELDPPGSGNGGILLTDRAFGDFEVTLEVKPDWGVCSGLFLRSTEKGQCYQVMIDYREKGNIGEIYREGLDGRTNASFRLHGIHGEGGDKVLTGIEARPAESNQRGASGEPGFAVEDWARIWKLNDWNRLKARIVGNPPTITTSLNGHFITEYTSDRTFEGTLEDRGFVAVQVHGGKSWPSGARIRFRNIAVTEL